MGHLGLTLLSPSPLLPRLAPVASPRITDHVHDHRHHFRVRRQHRQSVRRVGSRRPGVLLAASAAIEQTPENDGGGSDGGGNQGVHSEQKAGFQPPSPLEDDGHRVDMSSLQDLVDSGESISTSTAVSISYECECECEYCRSNLFAVLRVCCALCCRYLRGYLLHITPPNAASTSKNAVHMLLGPPQLSAGITIDDIGLASLKGSTRTEWGRWRRYNGVWRRRSQSKLGAGGDKHLRLITH